MGIKGTGLDDVGTRLEILAVNLSYNVGASQSEYVVIALKTYLVVDEKICAKILLVQTVALNHRSHRAIQHHDTLG